MTRINGVCRALHYKEINDFESRPVNLYFHGPIICVRSSTSKSQISRLNIECLNEFEDLCVCCAWAGHFTVNFTIPILVAEEQLIRSYHRVQR